MTTEDPGLNPAISNFYRTYICCQLHINYENKGNGLKLPILKVNYLISQLKDLLNKYLKVKDWWFKLKSKAMIGWINIHRNGHMQVAETRRGSLSKGSEFKSQLWTDLMLTL